ncbi:unnamed protein product [Sphagnum troendelagicum]|uniref:Uncharacterized protein n=1 Tax=Sphagnum jensenii TaxID=128206 RepID=A0ABP0W2S4_9BRYO
MKNYQVAALMQLVDARKIDHGVSGEMISSDGSEDKAFHIISCPDGGSSKWNPPRKPPHNQRPEAHKTSVSTFISCQEWN